MPQIYLCFLWHMHQPFYKDLISGEYKLPWTRMHALKDYYGMVRILEEFPEVRQTFNLVPSMMVQVEEYAAGAAVDPFLQLALKPAESSDGDEQRVPAAALLPRRIRQRMIYRYPRYGELFDAWQAAGRNPARAATVRRAGVPRPADVVAARLVRRGVSGARPGGCAAGSQRGRDFTLDDQRCMGESSARSSARCCPRIPELAATGQIEISTTPYYHPILPLLCDSQHRRGRRIPTCRCRRASAIPQDAAHAARDWRATYMTSRFRSRARGAVAVGGSVSDEALHLAAELGFEWAATDSGVLGPHLGARGRRGWPVPAVSVAAGRPPDAA